mmetsp:Transcript_19640/g.45746  ORF Transcript_19640/g.45746 Transcript_19640/m.45746 type:complete len:234 (-) Transcript_19640:760-1461(-)
MAHFTSKLLCNAGCDRHGCNSSWLSASNLANLCVANLVKVLRQLCGFTRPSLAYNDNHLVVAHSFEKGLLVLERWQRFAVFQQLPCLTLHPHVFALISFSLRNVKVIFIFRLCFPFDLDLTLHLRVLKVATNDLSVGELNRIPDQEIKFRLVLNLLSASLGSIAMHSPLHRCVFKNLLLRRRPFLIVSLLVSLLQNIEPLALISLLPIVLVGHDVAIHFLHLSLLHALLGHIN